MLRRCAAICAVLLAASAGGVPPLLALVQPSSSPVAAKAFRHPALYVQERNEPASAVLALAPAVRDAELAELGATATGAFFDSRTGRWSSLVLARPMLPGSGVGNRVSWISGHPPADDAEWREAAAAAVLGYVRGQAALRIDPSQISSTPRAAVLSGGDLVYVYIPRVVDGIPVRGNAVTATLNHGNLVLLGLPSWGNIDAALVSLDHRVRRRGASGSLPRSVPRARVARGGRTSSSSLPTAAMRCPTAWPGSSRAAWPATSDAGRRSSTRRPARSWRSRTGTSTRSTRIVGGVFPVSNDGSGPEGTEQAGFPMPWADVAPGGTSFTDGGGNAGCIPGSISTTLSGRFVKILDTCGAISETNAGDIDLGTSAGTDCTVPAGRSAGDTHSARSGFYELNRMKEQARGQLPANAWLQQQLTANMNIVDICNAFWDGNDGQLLPLGRRLRQHRRNRRGLRPRVGPRHGQQRRQPDDQLARRVDRRHLRRPAPQHLLHRARASCSPATATGYGDPCLDCSGVRDIDWANHTSNAPHGITFASTTCPAVGSRGPCNRETHCEGMVAAEVAWDLATRDLTAAPFNYSTELAREVSTRLFYLGSQVITNWYALRRRRRLRRDRRLPQRPRRRRRQRQSRGRHAPHDRDLRGVQPPSDRVRSRPPWPTRAARAVRPTAPAVTVQASRPRPPAELDGRRQRRLLRGVPHRGRGRLRVRQGQARRDGRPVVLRRRPAERPHLLLQRSRPSGRATPASAPMSVCASVVPAAGSEPRRRVRRTPPSRAATATPSSTTASSRPRRSTSPTPAASTQTNVRIVAIEPADPPVDHHRVVASDRRLGEPRRVRHRAGRLPAPGPGPRLRRDERGARDPRLGPARRPRTDPDGHAAVRERRERLPGRRDANVRIRDQPRELEGRQRHVRAQHRRRRSERNDRPRHVVPERRPSRAT